MSNSLEEFYPVPPEAVKMLLDRLFYPAPNTVPVIHPSFKALGRIWVPWPVLSYTSGLDRVMLNHPHAPSLCVLYQSGKCFSHEKCNQIHVNRQWATTVWHALEMASVNNCCRSCGDLPSLSHDLFQALEGQDVSLRISGAPPFAIPVEQLAATRFWQRFLDEERTNLYFNPDRVCMLHQQNTCKYGVECKNVHLCRNVWRELIKTIKSMPGVAFNEQWEAVAQAADNNMLAEDVPATGLKDSRLTIVHPDSGQEISVHGGWAERPMAAEVQAPPPVPLKRTTHALAIVDPKSGEEVLLKAKAAELRPTVPRAVPLLLDELDFGHTGIQCASAVLQDDEEDPLAPGNNRAPTIEALGVYDTEGADGQEEGPKAPHWAHRPADAFSDASPYASSGGTPVSPTSSIGSDSASVGSSALLSLRLNLKHGAKGKFRPRDMVAAPTVHGPDGADSKLWAQKIEANRGLFKKISHGLLGVVLTEGPKPTGFGAGRGSLRS